MLKQQIIQKINSEIDSIPPIPENIQRVKILIDDPRSSIQDISIWIRFDPGLTADLLRIANSARYMTRTRLESVDRAITVIGLRELSMVILRVAAKKVLEEHFTSFQEIWDHSVKCAFYAQHLTKLKKFPHLTEIAYTAGLLHDIGKLVLISSIPGIIDRINSLSENKDLSPSEIERIALGMTHAEIGARVMERWNFPDILINTIGYHHAPILALMEDRPLVYIVYLANILSKRDELPADIMLKIEPKVLDYFEIESEENLEDYLTSLMLNFKEAKKSLAYQEVGI